jgi:hypothetical protein
MTSCASASSPLPQSLRARLPRKGSEIERGRTSPVRPAHTAGAGSRRPARVSVLTLGPASTRRSTRPRGVFHHQRALLIRSPADQRGLADRGQDAGHAVIGLVGAGNPIAPGGPAVPLVDAHALGGARKGRRRQLVFRLRSVHQGRITVAHADVVLAGADFVMPRPSGTTACTLAKSPPRSLSTCTSWSWQLTRGAVPGRTPRAPAGRTSAPARLRASGGDCPSRSGSACTAWRQGRAPGLLVRQIELPPEFHRRLGPPGPLSAAC